MKEIKNIKIDFVEWDERCPCYMVTETDDGETGDYIDSAKDVICLLEETLKTSCPTRETQIQIVYKTETIIPLTMICSLSMQEILYFRNRPKYGIDFLPSVKMSKEEREELINNIFSNADEFLRKEICDVVEYLVNLEVTR